MASLSWTLLVFTFYFVKITTAAGQCYFPNGDSTTGDFPCDPDADDSPCCHGGQGSACLSNKLCRGPDGNTIRGSCTDQDWESSECAHYCLSANRGGTDLISCSNVTGIDTSYCCDHAVNCCNSGVGRFDVLPSEPDVWATWNRESSQFVVVRTITAEPSETSTSSATSASTTSDTEPSSSDSSAASPTDDSTQASAQPTLDPAPTTEEAQEDPGLSTAAKAGIGAGAGAGALLIAVVVFLLLKVRKSKKALQAQQTQHTNHQWPGAYQQPPAPYVYYKGGPADGWQQPPGVDGNGQAYNGKLEMDARPVEQHWARVELPANS